MKVPITSLVAVCLTMGVATNSISQTKTKEQMETITKKQSKDVVQGFFTAFGNGDFGGVINSFHDHCTIVAVRHAQRTHDQVYGTYEGKDGAKTFIGNLGNVFDTKQFTVEHIVGDGDVAYASGKFTHIVKSTGKSFQSDWALMCIIKDDKIFEYHFYEDSEKFLEASK